MLFQKLKIQGDDGDAPIATDFKSADQVGFAWGFAYGKSRVLPLSSHAKEIHKRHF